MPTTLTNGIQLPDKGSVDWYSSMQSNYNLIDTHLGDIDVHVTAEDKARWDGKQGSLSQAQLDAIAQVATNTDDIATLQSGKADASHTHSSSDITDIGDYATKQYVDNSISGLVDNAPDVLNTLNELSAALNDDSNFASTVTNALAAKANSSDLATVATSGSYTDLTDKPTINDSTITIQKNGSTVDTFTTNGSNKTINITVPTKTSDLTNDSNFVDTSNSAVASGITSAKVTDYDTHIADTDIHVTTTDKTKWNNGVSQAYVVRYASVAVSDNSTVPYANLNNTDNIKANDLLLDINGKLYQISSVDTSNETVSVTTPLTQLAVDSSVVHKSGNETISGDKTFANSKVIVGRNTDFVSVIQFVNSDVVGDSATGKSGFEVYGTSVSDANKIGGVTVGEYSNNGGSYAQIECNRTVSGVKSSNEIRNLIRSDGSKELSATIDNDCKLGSAFLRWSKIYGTEYYYGSNNVEFSTKFVTTDTAQTISGTKTFTNDLLIYNSDTTAYASYLILKNQRNVRGSSETGSQGLQYQDKNNKTLTMLESRVISNYNTSFNIICYNINDNNQTVSDGVSVIKSPTTTTFAPTTDNAVTCGRPLAKWSDVQTYKVNALEPSSLSLPSGNVSDVIDISSYLTILDGTVNIYTAPANGWIAITMNNCSGIQAYIAGLWGHQIVRPTAGGVRFFMPVLKNKTTSILIFGGSIDNARFIPCQGNV